MMMNRLLSKHTCMTLRCELSSSQTVEDRISTKKQLRERKQPTKAKIRAALHSTFLSLSLYNREQYLGASVPATCVFFSLTSSLAFEFKSPLFFVCQSFYLLLSPDFLLPQLSHSFDRKKKKTTFPQLLVSNFSLKYLCIH